MSDSANSKPQASAWVKPDQVEALRTAVYRCRPDYLQQRDEAIITLMYDTGLRVSELVSLNEHHLRDDNSSLYLPGGLQKDYPTDDSPNATRLGLSEDTSRVLTSYLNNRWKETISLFPSRSSRRITTQGVRDMLKKVATEAGVQPYLADGGRGGTWDVTPHALRHGVAFRMMNVEEGNTLYDVRNRLRHQSLATTERVYDHIVER